MSRPSLDQDSKTTTITFTSVTVIAYSSALYNYTNLGDICLGDENDIYSVWANDASYIKERSYTLAKRNVQVVSNLFVIGAL